METNKNYILGIEQALADNNLTKDDAVIIMCRSGGTRGAPAANLLFEKGFKKVYVVTNGFEGSSLKDGDKKGWRLKNGWKNSGLPWSYKLNKEKMYYNDTF
jgi:rhodanese-related sulfurtransferase